MDATLNSTNSGTYADAFAKVLRQNGIDCNVDSQLD